MFDDNIGNRNSLEGSIPGSIEELDKSLDKLFAQPKKYELYQFIAGIYCLNQIQFHRVEGRDGCIISQASEHALKVAAELLKVEREELAAILTNRTIQTIGDKGEKIT